MFCIFDKLTKYQFVDGIKMIIFKFQLKDKLLEHIKDATKEQLCIIYSGKILKDHEKLTDLGNFILFLKFVFFAILFCFQIYVQISKTATPCTWWWEIMRTGALELLAQVLRRVRLRYFFFKCLLFRKLKISATPSSEQFGY